jgi:type II secretory pathway component PulC
MNTAVTSPNSQVPSSSNMTTPTNTPTDNQNSGTLNQNVREKDSAQKGKSMKDEKGTSSEYALNRNPFLTPYIYLKNINNNSSPTPTPVITHVTPTPTVNPTPTPSTGPELRLGAICQQKNDKVAIIYVNGKGYIRRENEKIGGTEYYLKQISDKSVIIAKYNGEEKILKINEKALKLKGGD